MALCYPRQSVLVLLTACISVPAHYDTQSGSPRSAALLAAAVPQPHLPHLSNSNYDYIVIGGGTSGLTVANRLSENPNLNVLVIEAGSSVFDNPNVTDVNGYGLALGTDIDWQYESVNQTYGGGSPQVLRAGKALAGTSAINGMAYTRAEDVQIDAWQAIGNAGWTWNSLFPYYLKSENLTRPNQQQIEAGASYNPAVNGEEGHLHVGFKDYPVGDLTTYLNQTYQGLGIPWTEDVNGGKMRGFNIMPSTIDYAAQVREDAARAYYWPFKSRANLHVMLDTFVNRIVWDGKALDGQVTAQGVEVTSSNGTVSVIPAKREVIVSAGSLKSPGILELSGIGNPAILRKHNIPVQVDLPTVGENLQDQTNTDMGASGFRNITGANTLVYPNIYDIFGNETESLAQSLLHKLKQYASDAAKVSGGTMKEADLERLFQLQYNLIFKENVPIAEIIISPGGGKAVASEYWGLLPFSRGNVHISSSSPLDKPTINPNYFMFDYDMDIHVSIAKFIRRIFETEPMRGLIQEETAPGFSAVAQNSSDDAWKNWLLDGHYRSNFHPVGTAAMMPRSLGGVVNDQLTVYGTTNVRVIDASIVPFQVCGHLTSTLYAISERVAEIMKMEAAF